MSEDTSSPAAEEPEEGYDPDQDPDSDPEMIESGRPAKQGENTRDPAEGADDGTTGS
jgi:hypothetical protein